MITLAPFHAIAKRPTRIDSEEVLAHVDMFRTAASRTLDDSKRSELGQFLTPIGVARLMASMFTGDRDNWRILDAGAGVGSLSAALIAQLCGKSHRPDEITLIAYEVDPVLVGYLLDTVELCAALCRSAGIRFEGDVRRQDFIEASVRRNTGLFSGEASGWNAAILNPPYRKINSESRERSLLREAGI